jgi:hypothetical protein
MDYTETKRKIREIWPQLADMLENPAMYEALAKDGLEVDSVAIARMSKELGIHISLSEDGRFRCSVLASQTMNYVNHES